ncbi:MAG: dihydroorotase [Eggerthellales bacterium]|nr:dihydroorotase [Eggerthellales bacterium]
MALILKNVRAIDPQVNLDEVCDVLIEGDKISQVGKGINAEGAEVRDMIGKVLVPGLVDIHVHLREPGYEQKEDIQTGTCAAAHGGFTAVCAMPNTLPVTDTALAVEYTKARAKEVGKCRVHVSGACTKGLKGESLSEMGDMAAHGAVAFTDDGRGVQTAGMMRRVMDYAVQFNKVVMSHCQDESLVGSGQVNEGVVSTRLGVAGWPAEGEELQIVRDIALSRLTGCPLHIQHISTERGLNAVRAAKEEGLKVTCEATPHHLFLNEDMIGTNYDTNFKVNPPLRTIADNQALIQGVVDGSVDVIVTDHAPHTAFEKDREFELAPFGMTGIETSLGLMLTNLVNPGVISWQRLVELMCIKPREILRVEPVSISAGSTADITVIDPALAWTVTEEDFESRASNCAFIGYDLVGRATDVYVGGVATMIDCKVQ